jgi:hypothetical protein
MVFNEIGLALQSPTSPYFILPIPHQMTRDYQEISQVSTDSQLNVS